MHKQVLPYPGDLPAAFESYCEQMKAAINGKKHHDQRRHLFINFLRKGLGIEAEEIELEHKIKAISTYCRIDADSGLAASNFKS